MTMVTESIKIVQAWLTGLIAMFVSAFSGIADIFYDSAPEGGGFTIIGVFLLFGLGFTILFFAFRFISGLIRR